MLAAILQRTRIWLGRKPQSVPILVELRMTRLRDEARRGGRGSDLAAAELRGMQTAIMALRRAT